MNNKYLIEDSLHITHKKNEVKTNFIEYSELNKQISDIKKRKKNRINFIEYNETDEILSTIRKRKKNQNRNYSSSSIVSFIHNHHQTYYQHHQQQYKSSQQNDNDNDLNLALIKIVDIDDIYLYFSTTNSSPILNFPSNYAVPDHLIKTFNRNSTVYTDEFLKDTSKSKSPITISILRIGRGKSFLPNSERKLTLNEKNHLTLINSYWTVKELSRLALMHLKCFPISFSLIEWLCIVFSKKFPDFCKYEDNKKNVFRIHESYIETSKRYLKPFFDPFAREPRLIIEFEDIDNTIVSKIDLERLQIIKKFSSEGIIWDHENSLGLRIIFHNNIKKNLIYLVTSVGQLIFMMWAFQYKVVDFAINHVKEIKHHMKLSNSIK